MNRAILVAAVMSVTAWESVLTAADYAGPEMPRVITGQVTDQEGRPTADALIEWGPRGAAPGERETVRSDANGKYRLETRRVGKDYRLGAAAAGCAPWWRDSVFPGGIGAPSEINIELRPGGDWTIRAVDGAGQPVTGVSVIPMTPVHRQEIFNHFGPPPPPSTLYPGASRAVPLDATGVAVLRDLYQPPTVRVEADGPLTPEQEAEMLKRAEEMNWLHLRFEREGQWVHDAEVTFKQAQESREITVVFPDDRVPGFRDRQTGVLRGRVIDQETRQPVTSAVVVRRYDAVSLPVDAQGRFELGPKLTNGNDYQLRIFAAGYAVEVARQSALSPSDSQEMVYELKRHASFEGRLIDAATGRPLARVQLVAGAPGPMALKYVEWSTLDSYADGHHSLTNVVRVMTDVDGRFAVPESPGAAATVIVLTGGYARCVIPPDQRPAANAEGVVTIELQPESSLTIVAERDALLGAQADSAYIGYQSTDGFEHMYHSQPLDAEGRLRIDRLPAGVYHVGLFRYSGQIGFATLTRRIELRPGAHREERLGKLPGQLTLSGWAPPLADIHIQRIAPQPAVQIDILTGAVQRDPPVQVPAPVEREDYTIQADVDGRFELRGLPPGQYQVGPRERDWSVGIEARTIDLNSDAQVILRSVY